MRTLPDDFDKIPSYNSKQDTKPHDPNDLICLFNQCFASESTYNTRLVQGDDEPLYLPADAECNHHQVIFAHGFFSSALHECAHWLIAGNARRQLVDYGYWYEPDGRNAMQQRLFQQVEIKPQALEWILSDAAGFAFQLSFDNLNGEWMDPKPFEHAVQEQVLRYQTDGLPHRANLFYKALRDFF